jgi:hypothetical protein
VNNLTAKDLFTSHGTNAHTALTGEDGNTSNLCQHKWHDWCYFREQKQSFPFNQEMLGRVLGPRKAREMKWRNGSSKQMATSYRDARHGPSKLTNCTRQLKSRREKSSTD